MKPCKTCNDTGQYQAATGIKKTGAGTAEFDSGVLMPCPECRS